MPQDRGHIHTEQSNPLSAQLDCMSLPDAVRLMNQEDQRAVEAVDRCRKEIVKAVEMVTGAFRAGGRLLYVGAGTSGRLGVLDAAECPPTFSSNPLMVAGIIAGGNEALQRSVEGAEDDAEAGAMAMREKSVGPLDVVCGITAGGTTPYVHGAMREARLRGTKSIFITCTAPEHAGIAELKPDLLIHLQTGPEVLTGSTRLKAGTATKLTLNTITTLAMVGMGKVFKNIMVDVDASKNAKLVDRAIRIVQQTTGRSRPQASELLADAGGSAKRAIVMHHRKCSSSEAQALLQQAAGNLRAIINN